MNLITEEHPFAEFIKILGKGKKGARSLSQDEAFRAMQMILTNQVEPVQLGAFLMLMRVKEETSAELTGFVLAAKQTIEFSRNCPAIDLDWSSYAGKRRHLPWFLLATLLLASQGIKVLIHGAAGHSEERVYTENVLASLGIPYAKSIKEAEQQLEKNNFCYLSLAFICPKLFEIINLRPVLGLRSPVHTLVRLLNPFNANHSIQGIFHPSYRQVHQHAALMLNIPHMAVLKGEGGETERNPDVACLVQSVNAGELCEETWPAFFTHRHLKDETLNSQDLLQLWEGEREDAYAQATVTGTTAIAIKLLGKADNQTEAQQLAEHWWQNRDKQFLRHLT